ncbi:hypothetical protein [uncultured Zoogloea sp.]|uniref:hypothetical protein n=1 Tax=uncultured Zoogloea sp. TaxID=160237 RepID=UPI00261DCBB1|nr:hypothetical protein [uncultured Zoogloea sp.]
MSQDLMVGLAAPASAARWLLQAHPELLDGETLTLLIPGAGIVECTDEGRWFAFLPWLLGRPNLRTEVFLVGDPLVVNRLSSRDAYCRGVSSLARCPPPHVFSGTLHQWSAAHLDVKVDACVLFSPNFSAHYKTWFAPGELGELLASVPVGLFARSQMEALQDQQTLKLLGFEFSTQEKPENPWWLCFGYDEEFDTRPDERDCFAQYGWTLRDVVAPVAVALDNPALAELLDLQRDLEPDLKAQGPEIVMSKLSCGCPLGPSSEHPDDWLYVLPNNFGVLRAEGLIVTLTPEGLVVPFKPPVHVPSTFLDSRPPESDPMGCVFWALRLYRNEVAPLFEATEYEKDWPETGAQLVEWLKRSIGKSWADYLREGMRHSGMPRSPTYPKWWTLLESLGWALSPSEKAHTRYNEAFYACSKEVFYGDIPVVCLPYVHLPDEQDDYDALEDLDELADYHPEVVLVLYSGIPFIEKDGHAYCLGGMLFWRDAWHPFAINKDMTSPDKIIEQVKSGFTFEAPTPQYAADPMSLAIPFNRMCHDRDPYKDCVMIELKSGNWTISIPG